MQFFVLLFLAMKSRDYNAVGRTVRLEVLGLSLGNHITVLIITSVSRFDMSLLHGKARMLVVCNLNVNNLLISIKIYFQLFTLEAGWVYKWDTQQIDEDTKIKRWLWYYWNCDFVRVFKEKLSTITFIVGGVRLILSCASRRVIDKTSFRLTEHYIDSNSVDICSLGLS